MKKVVLIALCVALLLSSCSNHAGKNVTSSSNNNVSGASITVSGSSSGTSSGSASSGTSSGSTSSVANSSDDGGEPEVIYADISEAIFSPPIKAKQDNPIDLLLKNLSDYILNGYEVKIATTKNLTFNVASAEGSATKDGNYTICKFKKSLNQNDTAISTVNMYVAANGNYTVNFYFYKTDGVTPIYDNKGKKLTTFLKFTAPSKN